VRDVGRRAAERNNVELARITFSGTASAFRR
jgi:hypothetical protein